MAQEYYKKCEELDTCNALIEQHWEKKEFEQCFNGHLTLAQKGFALAECQTGYFCEEGLGTERDKEQALYWTERAAYHGDRDGQCNLAEFYEDGIFGVEKNEELAKFWYAKAAEQGQDMALVKCEEYGISVSVDKTAKSGFGKHIEKLSPAFKDYLWGGTKLRDVYGKNCDFEKVAESWELSTHPAGQSKLTACGLEGPTLGEYFSKAGSAVLGKNCENFENFPVLIKFIDAKQPLSIQVHPSDEYALENEREYGKTEMWYIMDCEPGAFLYFGVNREVTKEEFRERIENNTVLEVLNRVDVHPGDVFFIESGTIHAIGAGILICEIQQNSNCTYRVYDYDRRGGDGKPRELHIEKALQVSKLTPSDTTDKQGKAEEINGGTVKKLAGCKYFTTERLEINGTAEIDVNENSFASFIVIEGHGTLAGDENTVEFKAGDSLFVPAGAGTVKLSGECTLIKTTV